VSHEFGGDTFRQVFRAQSRVVQKAREPLEGRFLVFKGLGQLGLPARFGFQQGGDKGDEGFDLMTVRPRIKSRDKLGQANGARRSVCFHKPIFSRVYNSLPFANLQKVSRRKHMPYEICSSPTHALRQQPSQPMA
jgi:hypothetical protein